MRTNVAAALPLCLLAGLAGAEGYEMRILSGSVQLGGSFTLVVSGDDTPVPHGARCILELPDPFAEHVTQQTETCDRLDVTQAFVPILDEAGYAIPSAQVPATIRVIDADGGELGAVETVFPYNNQFSDLRIVLEGIRNPVSEGESFRAVVQGAGAPIDPALTCRWNTYGPMEFTPESDNGCIGTVTALAPSGRDADMDVQIVNLVDMHAVGYATASMIVE